MGTKYGHQRRHSRTSPKTRKPYTAGRKRYALFTNDVRKKDIYSVTTPPKKFYYSRKKAEKVANDYGFKVFEYNRRTVTHSIPKIKKGDKIVVPYDVSIKHWITRYGEPYLDYNSLHDGQYIIDSIRKGSIHLVDAKWDNFGRITYHSNKHGHLIPLNNFKTELKRGRISKVTNPSYY